MNKTVNINLANVFFHIDEEAYIKLSRYLEAVKRSFAGTPGSDEIIADIEARIAELFQEKMEHERQVITQKEVDEVIAIMGQPEDYLVDEEIFEDEPRPKTTQKRAKKLYRDTENKYVAGVSAGLAHYFGIDPIWVRLLWIVLTIGSSGGFILIYGLLWILIPEAATTAQKLDMRGEDVNISNIERKVKEGFEDVADKVKNVDYAKMGDKVKSGGRTFFDTLGDIILFVFKVIGKFIGLLLIIVGAATIIGLFIGLLTVGILDMVHIPGVNFYNMVNTTGMPIWLASTLLFFAIGIPFFFLLYLGLKILVNNLKSIGNIAKFSLLGLWLIALITLIVFGIREAAAHAYTGTVKTEDTLLFEVPTDTLNIALMASEAYESGNLIRMRDAFMTYDANGDEVLMSNEVRFNLKESKDSLVRLVIFREAEGPSINEARQTAEKIEYTYEVEGNTLRLDDYLTAGPGNRLMDQEMRIDIFLPEGTVVGFERPEGRCWSLRSDNDQDMDGCELTEHTWRMDGDGRLLCLDCPERPEEDNAERNRINIGKDGVDININEDGESFQMKIDEGGVRIKANDRESDYLDVDINAEDEDIRIQIEEDSTTVIKSVTKD